MNTGVTVCIYGAYGYSGRVVCDYLFNEGYDLVLAGRNTDKLTALRYPHKGLIAEPIDSDALVQKLKNVSVLLNCAGPFKETAESLMSACIASQTHYLDISGEFESFLLAEKLGPHAQSQGVMLMPGAGFANAPSDIVSNIVISRVPDARYLRIGLSKPQFISRGTLRTALAAAANGAVLRRNNKLIYRKAGSMWHSFDFGDGARPAGIIPWPDIVTAFHSCSAANVEVYLEMNNWQQLAPTLWTPLLTQDPTGIVSRTSAFFERLWPEGPDTADRLGRRQSIVVEAEDRWGRTFAWRLNTLDGYSMTGIAARAAIARTIKGQCRPGFCTPSMAFGEGFLSDLSFVTLEKRQRNRSVDDGHLWVAANQDD